MKNTAKLVLKGLLVIVLFTGSTIALSSIGVKSVNEAKAAVSYQQVYTYLVNHGYTVITLEETFLRSDENWIAHTIKNGIHYWTTVIVEGSQIVTANDVPM